MFGILGMWFLKERNVECLNLSKTGGRSVIMVLVVINTWEDENAKKHRVFQGFLIFKNYFPIIFTSFEGR